MQIPEATKLPIKAEKSGDFSNTVIYSLPEKPGLYRRVSREGRGGVKPGDGNVLATLEPWTLAELVRWTEGEALLRPLLPGVESPGDDKPY